MKKKTFAAITIGLLSAIIPISFGYHINNWQWWAISLPIIIVFNIIYINLKE